MTDIARQASLSALARSLVIAALPIVAISLLIGRFLVSRALRPLSVMAERAASLAVERKPRSLGARSGLREAGSMRARDRGRERPGKRGPPWGAGVTRVSEGQARGASAETSERRVAGPAVGEVRTAGPRGCPARGRGHAASGGMAPLEARRAAGRTPARSRAGEEGPWAVVGAGAGSQGREREFLSL